MAVFICDVNVEDQLLGIIIQCFSCMFEFTVVYPLAVNEFPYFCDELAGSFESRSFASYMCEIFVLCTYEGFRNET